MRSEMSVLGYLSLAVVMGSACGGTGVLDPGPGKRVEAQVAQEIYYSGQDVVVTIRNVSGITLDYNYGFCPAKLQRLEPDDAWTDVGAPPDGCPLALGILGPGQSVPFQFHLTDAITIGQYRFALPMPHLRDATAPEPDLLTPPFVVNPGTSN